MGFNFLAGRLWIVDLKSGGWWVDGALGSKRTQMVPKYRGPDLLQKLELGQTGGMYGSLLGQRILPVTLF